MTAPKRRARREKLGRHVLINGDAMTVLRRMNAASIDVIVTSPPYNIGLPYNSYKDAMADADYLDWMIRICQQLKRVLRPEGSFFLNISGTSRRPWLPFELAMRLQPLFSLQNHIIWVKSLAIGDVTHGHFKPLNSTRFLNHNHEHVFHFTHEGAVVIDRLAIGVPFKDKSNIARRNHARDCRCRGNTWYIPYETVRTKQQKFMHPGTFPVGLPGACLALHGVDENSIVLDPFLGSGSTLVAAEGAGANGIGIELDPTYYRTARARLRALMPARAGENAHS
ncbi:site-specific DNA-methyltransferase [Candidatus Kirkpatrickella diaphorinae]|uniref:Methyltransferase n=1 Tax=Candidatus Kirkpatrickella diaphorinae TaxID=2984322 RepID=A0ABY6GM06_9PROT|nr:site-specific DNA-methyltransferase [Candidatus Kirkpatrickella diaphorinae]UYH52131.1 site-specific DNA-methyltransferase [Candidatus Kirkpatrickella diaphorinae]